MFEKIMAEGSSLIIPSAMILIAYVIGYAIGSLKIVKRLKKILHETDHHLQIQAIYEFLYNDSIIGAAMQEYINHADKNVKSDTVNNIERGRY